MYVPCVECGFWRLYERLLRLERHHFFDTYYFLSGRLAGAGGGFVDSECGLSYMVVVIIKAGSKGECALACTS